MNEEATDRDLDRGRGLPHAVQQWQAPAPLIEADRILRVHGYKDPGKVRPVIRRTAQEIARRAAGLAVPQACWRRVPVAQLAVGVLTLDDGTSLACDAFDRLLGGASEVVIFVLTLGRPFDVEVIRLIEEFEPLEALFMESSGWLMIERLTQQFSKDLRGSLSQSGLRLGYRMGPGYSYRGKQRGIAERVIWPLEQQQDLFRLFGAAALPVALMSSSAMTPKMSRSGLFGVHSGV